MIGQEIRRLTTKRASRRTLLLKKFIPIGRAGARAINLYNWGSQKNSKDEHQTKWRTAECQGAEYFTGLSALTLGSRHRVYPTRAIDRKREVFENKRRPIEGAQAPAVGAER